VKWLAQNMSGGRYTQNDSAGAKPVMLIWGAHLHHLANTIKPSVCDSNAALYQVTFDHLLLM